MKRGDIVEKLYETRSEFWNIHPDSADVLCSYIRAQQPKNILEIGTSNGLSAILMARIAKTYGGAITTIEYFQKRADLAKDHFQEAGVDDVVHVVNEDAVDFLHESSQIWDFIFLDAGKEEYLSCLHLFKDRMKKGSTLIADNTVSHRAQLKDFLEAVRSDPLLSCKELDIGEGLCVATRIA